MSGGQWPPLRYTVIFVFTENSRKRFLFVFSTKITNINKKFTKHKYNLYTKVVYYAMIMPVITKEV